MAPPHRPARARAPRFNRIGVTVLAACAVGLSIPASAQPGTRALVVESIEAVGNTRTSLDRVTRIADLAAGDVIAPELLLEAAERLRESHLFRNAEVHARRGSAPGRVVVVFDVEENRPHLRLGAGYEDFSGWYFIPIEANLDNVTGHGEQLRLRTRFGYRVGGLVADFLKPDLSDPRRYVGLRVRAETLSRIYYAGDVEIRHEVERSGIDVRFGRPVGRHVALDAWLSAESVDAASTAEVYRTNDAAGVKEGDTVPYAELDPDVRRAVPARGQLRAGLALRFDSRQGRNLATRGFRARGSAESVHANERDAPSEEVKHFGIWELDARGYVPLSRGVQLAARARLGAMAATAPFFERFYLGGLYTVRGYPSQSLSPTSGDRYVATASVELRTLLHGTPARPTLAGVFFLDAGVGWNEGSGADERGAGGIGYGLRVRVPWVEFIGVDVGVPLSPSPVAESFHGNVSLGWTF